MCLRSPLGLGYDSLGDDLDFLAGGTSCSSFCALKQGGSMCLRRWKRPFFHVFNMPADCLGLICFKFITAMLQVVFIVQRHHSICLLLMPCVEFVAMAGSGCGLFLEEAEKGGLAGSPSDGNEVRCTSTSSDWAQPLPTAVYLFSWKI